MKLEALQSEFSHNDEVSFELLAPNYPVLHISNKYASASIALHGAQVTDFTPRGDKPVIFTSKEAIFKEGKAIRGGIPVCWPWFGDHPEEVDFPAHGFARNCFWQLISIESEENSSIVKLELPISELQHKMIGGEATLRLTISIGQKLSIALTTTNKGSTPLTIGGALHSYLKVSDSSAIRLEGLENTPYIDKLTGQTSAYQTPIQFTEEYDRIFLPTTTTTEIKDPHWNRSIIIEKSGSQGTTVWNPWAEKSTAMADLSNQEYLEFICVEAINWGCDLRTIAPGLSHTLSQTIYLAE